MTTGIVTSRPLRVAIHCQILPNRGEGGLETFLLGLLHALGQLDDDSTEYLIVGPHQDPEWMKPYLGPQQRIVWPRLLDPSLRVSARRLRNRLAQRFWSQVPASDGFYENLGCDVVHFPYQHFVLCALPAVYNPHDLQYIYYPQFFTPAQIAWRRAVDRVACQRARTVTVSSRWVKQDIVQHYGIDADRIQVIPGAPPTRVYADPSPHEIESVRAIYGLKQPFALYPAMTWEHKNHLRLLEALALLRDRDDLKVHLVCCGRQNQFWPRIEERLNALGLHGQVRFLGMVPTEHLRALYRLSQFVVIPTLFEATSGPLLEAWQEGIPATCSRVTALPEQAGDAALLFDPLSVEAIAEAVAHLATNSDLREDLRRRGARRLQDFSWDRTARAYRAVYRRAAGFPLGEEDRYLLSRDWSQDTEAR